MEELQVNGNDLHITITKQNGEVLLDEDCCMALTYIMNSRAEFNSNFAGVHNDMLLKIVEKLQRDYVRELKKAFKEQEKESKKLQKIKVFKDEKNPNNDKTLDDFAKMTDEELDKFVMDKLQSPEFMEQLKKEQEERMKAEENKENKTDKDK